MNNLIIKQISIFAKNNIKYVNILKFFIIYLFQEVC
jgi:hypothetical protein